MALALYVPPAWPGVGRGTFRAVEGCQRVTEPSLSPLLYKLETSRPRAGEYRCGGPNVRTEKIPDQINFLFPLIKRKKATPKRSGFFHLFSAKKYLETR